MPEWRRNLYILFLVQVLSVAGFSLVYPFMPLYVEELGVATRGSVAFWSGLVFSSQAVTMMLSSPVWGAVADRYGRKPMLIRATIGGAVMVSLMGFAQSAEQLVLIRTLQGFLTGIVSATSAMVAATVPKEKSGESLGLIQTGLWVGAAVGPLIGGLVSEAFGYRASFWFTGAALALAGVAVIVWVREDFEPPPVQRRVKFWTNYRNLLRAPDMGSLYWVSFLQSLGRSVTMPLLAFFFVDLLSSSEGAAVLSGMSIGAKAAIGSVSAIYLGRLSDRIGHEQVLTAGAAFAILAYFSQTFVTNAWQLLFFQALIGVSAGAIMPATSALLNLRTPEGSHGTTFGLSNSVNAAGRMVAPMLGAAVYPLIGMRGVFAVVTIVYVVLALAALYVWRKSPAGIRVGAPSRVSGD
ncbi:MAG: MFS transporter [Caldilineaceae bacterium]|nr:MFS transporter [Caldilineaceae bacterium]MDE0462077.1 MFS transporter [Caldilineaceae bacterium]